MKNVIVYLLVLFVAPVCCVAQIELDNNGNYVEFAYATMSDGVKIAVAVGYPKGFDPQDQTQKWPAILAGIGSGLFQDFEDGCNQLVRFKKKYLPDSSHHAIYQKVFDKYIKLYNQLTQLGLFTPRNVKKSRKTHFFHMF